MPLLLPRWLERVLGAVVKPFVLTVFYAGHVGCLAAPNCATGSQLFYWAQDALACGLGNAAIARGCAAKLRQLDDPQLDKPASTGDALVAYSNKGTGVYARSFGDSNAIFAGNGESTATAIYSVNNGTAAAVAGPAYHGTGVEGFSSDEGKGVSTAGRSTL